MSSAPPGISPLRLPHGEIVFYSTGRPSIRSLTREIAALGFEVSGFPLPHTNLRPLPLGVWHWAVVLGDIVLFIVAPTAPSSSDSSSDQSGYVSSHNEPDSDNVDPDFPENGYWRSSSMGTSRFLGVNTSWSLCCIPRAYINRSTSPRGHIRAASWHSLETVDSPRSPPLCASPPQRHGNGTRELR